MYMLCAPPCKPHASPAMSARLWVYSHSLLLNDLEQTTFASTALSLTLNSQVHDNYRHRQSEALAEVCGFCDSDDSPDADNGNGCVVVPYCVLHTKPA